MSKVRVVKPLQRTKNKDGLVAALLLIGLAISLFMAGKAKREIA